MEWTMLTNIAIIATAVIALCVYGNNSIRDRRNKRIENLSRFIEVHRQLFVENGYIMNNIEKWEIGSDVHGAKASDEELKFHAMLLDVERLALLANNDAVPRRTQIYMFGWYAPHIIKQITEKERKDVFWELAIIYLDGLARDAKDFERLDARRRERFYS